jgi:hypothetical protein
MDDFLQKECSEKELRLLQKQTKRMIPARLTDLFVIWFEEMFLPLVAEAKVNRTVHWRDAIVQCLPSFVIPNPQKSKEENQMYSKIMRYVNEFIMEVCPEDDNKRTKRFHQKYMEQFKAKFMDLFEKEEIKSANAFARVEQYASWVELIEKHFPTFDLPSCVDETAEYNPRFHQQIHSLVSWYLESQCSEAELKDINVNRRKKLIPLRIATRFITWFKESVIKSMSDFIDQNANESEISIMTRIHRLKLPARLKDAFCVEFEAVMALTRPYSEEENVASAMHNLFREESDHEVLEKGMMGLSWRRVLQKEFPLYDLPDKDIPLIQKKIHERFLVEYTAQEKGLVKLSHFKEIPSRFVPEFVSWFEDSVIRSEQFNKFPDMLWRDILKERYSTFEPPSHLATARYDHLLSAIDGFLQRECDPDEFSLLQSSKRKKIPGRLINKFVAWFKRADRCDFRLNAEGFPLFSIDSDSDEDISDSEDEMGTENFQSEKNNVLFENWKSVIQDVYPTCPIPSQKPSRSMNKIVECISLYMKSNCIDEELDRIFGPDDQIQVPLRIRDKFVAWFMEAERCGFPLGSLDQDVDADAENGEPKPSRNSLFETLMTDRDTHHELHAEGEIMFDSQLRAPWRDVILAYFPFCDLPSSSENQKKNAKLVHAVASYLDDKWLPEEIVDQKRSRPRLIHLRLVNDFVKWFQSVAWNEFAIDLGDNYLSKKGLKAIFDVRPFEYLATIKEIKKHPGCLNHSPTSTSRYFSCC